MKRKLIAALLCLAMVLSLTGCQPASRDNQEAESAVMTAAPAETQNDGAKSQNAGAEAQNDGVKSQSAGAEDQSAGAVTENDARQGEGSQTQSDIVDDTALAQRDAASALRIDPNSKVAQKLNKEFHEHSEEAQNWLYDYLFGATTDESEAEDEEEGESVPAQQPVQPSEAEISDALKAFLSKTNYLTEEDCKKTAIQEHVDLKGRTVKQIYDELEAKNLLKLKAMEIYNSMSPQTKERVLQFLSTNQVEEESVKPKKNAPLNLAGKGHAWIVDVIQSDEAGARLWRELSPKTREKLTKSADAAEHHKETGASTSETKPEVESNSAQRSPLLIVLIVVSAVLLIALIIVLTLFLRRTKEMQERISKERNAKRKLEQELEQSKESRPRVEHKAAPSGTMSPAMRMQFQNSPTRVSTPRRAQQYQTQTQTQTQTYKAPASGVRQVVEEPKPVKVGIGAVAAAAASQRDGSSAPAASFSAVQPVAVDNHNVIDGYYAVTAKCREDARYNLDVSLVIEKRSAQPVDPPLPYIVYGDRSVALNMDYYNRVGGARPSNERAWDSMMNAATQIDRCFNIRSVSTGTVTTPAAAAGRKIMEVRRARIDENGMVAAKGEIVLE